MAGQVRSGSKLKANDRVVVPTVRVIDLATQMFVAAGCDTDVARAVARHLAEADHCGVESHGLVRVLQYTREFRDGTLDPSARPVVHCETHNRLKIDAGGGIGIPAMALALREAAKAARTKGMAVASVVGAGHTGRLGAFAEEAARNGCMTITLGGGNRQTWRMVAPYGGRQALLPTNPYCIGIPGGANGPVVLDIATSQIAGGWIYAARAAGVDLPEGAVIDQDGTPTRNPADYFKGGAILPKGGPLGSGLALIAELVGEAMLGPVGKGEINWLVLALDCGQFRGPGAMQSAAEEILAEIRACPPAQGVDRVMVPGERERDHLAGADRDYLHMPRAIWQQIQDMALDLGIKEGTI